MLRFRFALTPLPDVAAWGDESPTLHWFGLSDGCYWLEADGHELLRYAGPGEPAYVDYYVTRLWEDLLGMLPEVLEAVPPDLVDFVAEELPDWGDAEPTDAALEAAVWRDERQLDLGYLRDAPRLRFWRTTEDADTVVLDWRHRADAQIAFAEPAELRVTMPADDFITAVHDFDREFLAAMEERVSEVEAAGGIPGVEIDVAWLRQDHRTRAAALARERRADTDWELVRAGARELRQHRL